MSKIVICEDIIPAFRKGREKPVYRSSSIKHYFVCPKRYLLSLTKEKEWTDMIRNGLIFEGELLGWKSESLRARAIGKKRTKTGKETLALQALKARADFVRPLFILGEAYKLVYYDTKEWRLRGEIDFFGKINHKGEEVIAIVDVKLTSDMERQWNYIEHKEELLQSVCYPYLMWKRTGKIYPFIYLIVENKYDMPLVKTIKVTCSLQDFQWFEKKLSLVHNDLFYRANPDIATCLGSYNRRCDYIQYCQEGRLLVAQDWDLTYEQLKG